MHMETRNSKTEMPLFKVRTRKFIFVGEKTIMKLSDMCIMFEDGDWIESKDQSDDGIRLLQTGNIGEGKFLEKEGKERFISRETFEKLKCKEVFSGDILISRLPEPVGRACLVPEKKQRMITAVDCTICRIDDKKIRRRYLCYYLQSANYYTQLKNSITGTTRKRISRKNLGNIEIKIPNDKKQEEVIKQLDLIVEIIDNKKKKLQLLDTLVKSRFVEMFGDPDTNAKDWEEDALSEKLNVVGGYAFKSDQFDENSGIPVLRIANINAGYFKPVNMVYWKEDKNLERYAVYPGDLVMSLTGTVGKDDYGNVCILSNDYEMYYLNQRNAKLEIKEGINKHYLSQLLKFEQIKKKLTGISRGVRQANISNKDILNLVVPIPPIELQNQFADFVSSIDKSKSKIQKSLEETQLLFDSLMQKYFG